MCEEKGLALFNACSSPISAKTSLNIGFAVFLNSTNSPTVTNKFKRPMVINDTVSPPLGPGALRCPRLIENDIRRTAPPLKDGDVEP